MNYQQFISTRQPSADLRQFDDCAYGANNNSPDTYPEPIAGFIYGGSYSIRHDIAPADGGDVYTVFIQFEQTFADLESAELELWYYYGRDLGVTVDLDLFERLGMACRQSDLDAACRYIQDGLGQDDGGCAGMFFSTAEGCDGPNDTNWRKADLRQRFEWMRDYIRSELCEVDFRLNDPDGGATARFAPTPIEGN